jgi:hypothetical protein
MTNTLKIAVIATAVCLSIPSTALARSRSMHNRTHVYNRAGVGQRSPWSVYRPGPTGDPNNAYQGYFANPLNNPCYHGRFTQYQGVC